MKRLSSVLIVFAFVMELFSQNYDIDVVPGKIVKTFGWADMANDGKGISYPDTKNIIVIDDETYPNPVEKRKAFTNAIASGNVSGADSHKPSEKPAIIILIGILDLSDGKVNDKDHSYWDEFDPENHARLHMDICYEVGSNKAIIGVNGAKIMFGGLTINGYKDNSNLGKNVIIQNIEFWDSHGSTEFDTKANGKFTKNGKEYPYADANNKASSNNLGIGYGNTIGGTAAPPENIWIDHCKFSDGTCNDMVRNFNHDGALDIPFGKNITVSYCEFTNHDKVMLVAPNENALAPEDRSVTLHHIYFHKTTQRTPRSRGTYMHIYNCLYDNIGVTGNSGYCLGPGTNSLYIVENNFFGKARGEILKTFDMAGDENTTTVIYTSGNNIKFTENAFKDSGKKKHPLSHYISKEKPWQIPYEYNLSESKELKKSLPALAGNDSTGSKSVRVNGVVYSE